VSDLQEKTGPLGPYYRLNLKLGKTNQLNKPDHIVIGSAPGKLCPYTITSRYISKLKHSTFLQPYCSASDSGKPDPNKKSINYGISLTDLRYYLTELGYEGDKFSEHSLKRGAATDSDAAGIPETDIQEQGGWTNIKTTRLYIDKKDLKSHAYTLNLIRKLL